MTPGPTAPPPVADASAPVLAAAHHLADTLLRPAAERVDRTVVPASHLAAVAGAGLLGVTAPAALGGGGLPAAAGREVVATLAGACGATWFVTTQHALPLATAVRVGHPSAAALATGDTLAGVAVAHVRRPGPPAVTAVRDGAGWRVSGHVGWLTSWGLAGEFLLGAVMGQDLLLALVPAREQPGLRASEPLVLAAMGATRTVTLDLDGLRLEPEQVVEVTPLAPWLEADRCKTANASPHTLGLVRECTTRLRDLALRRGDASAATATAASLADRLRDEAESVAQRAFALVDDVHPAEQVDERLALRAALLDLGVRSATALLVAAGGAGMAGDAAPQRLVREAAFGLVQAQTGPVREATLQHWSRA